MTFDNIVTELYLSKDLDECISKFVRSDLTGDFKQELFTIILEYDKEKIVSLYESRHLKYFVIRIIINLATQSRNVFQKKYFPNHVEHSRDIPDEPQIDKEVLFIKMEEAIRDMDIKNETFYYSALAELIKKYGSMSEAARRIGIDKATISRGIKKIRDNIKDE